MVVNKEKALYELAQKRKSEDLKRCGERKKGAQQRYYGLAEFHGGIYECNHVSPYTKTAGNINASVFVMLQDWSSADSLGRKEILQDSIELGFERSTFTNVRLQELSTNLLTLQIQIHESGARLILHFKRKIAGVLILFMRTGRK